MIIPDLTYIQSHLRTLKQTLQKHYPDFYNYIIDQPGKTISEKCYIYFKLPINTCKTCGAATSYIDFNHGYRNFCCYKCSRNNAHVIESGKKTMKLRHGEHYESIVAKTKATNINRYGGHPMRLLVTQEKSRKTRLNKYGDANYRNPEKNKLTCLKRYGVENVSKLDRIKHKKEQTTLEHYGVLNPFQADCVKEKIKQTCLEKYGVPCAGQISSKARFRTIVKTNLEKYGVPYGFLNTEPGYSKSSQEYFDSLKAEHPNAVYATNGGEYKVGPYLLDWYDPDTNTAIEFNGDYWHANPKFYNPEWIHPVKKCSAKEIWDKDIEKMMYLMEQGIDVKVVWESDIKYLLYIK